MILQAQHHLQTSSTVATRLSSPTSSSTGGRQLQKKQQQHRNDGEDKGFVEDIIGGFQWLQLSSQAASGGSSKGGAVVANSDYIDDDVTTSSPLVDRSGHSQASWEGPSRPRRNRSTDGRNSDSGRRYRRRHSSGDLGAAGGRDELTVEEGPALMVSHHHNSNFDHYFSHSPVRNHETQQRVRRRVQRRGSGNGSVSSTSSGGTLSSPHHVGSVGSGSSSGNNNGAYELKNAKDALEGSIAAVINFLRSSGVPKPSTDQLKRNLEMGRYFAVMKRVQEYVGCIRSDSEDETLAKVHLTVIAWEALCRLKMLEYKRAYKHAYRLRGYDRPYHHHHHHQPPAGGITSHWHLHSGDDDEYQNDITTASVASAAEIKQAIDLQIKLAEQSTSCQKQLYLVHRWQKRVLLRLKKASTIEPQGYQPIRCL